jgi:hypothetical protein
MTKPRTIAAIALASGTFGGSIGALAAAAVQSQASPQAIAAAVQRVTDSQAERSLRTISGALRSLGSTANTLRAELQTLDRSFSGTINSPLYTIQSQLFDICLNTISGGGVPVTCPTPTIEPGIAGDRRR